jgi:hypothetical protein
MTSLRNRNETAVPFRWLATVLWVLFVTISCSGSIEPRSGVTLLVTNGTCQGGHCDSLRVLGFPSNQPLTPGGFWSLDLGLITASEACFTLPPTAVFRVIGVAADGTRDTTTFTWTSAKSLALGAQPPSSSRLQANPSTTAFVPASAAGWRITVPGGSQATPSSTCTP